MKNLPLSKGYVALVSDEDFARVSEHKWHVSVSGCGYAYAMTRINRRHVFLHRFLLDAPRGLLVDHINGDTMDNRRENLRLATSSQNNINRHKPTRARSGHRHIEVRRGRYLVQMRIAGVLQHLGSFPTLEDAQIVVEHARRSRPQ